MRMQKGPRFLRELARGTVGGAKKRRLRVQQSQRRVAGMAKAAAGDGYRRRRRKRLAVVGWTHKKQTWLYTVRTTLYGVPAYTEPQTVESLFSLLFSPLPYRGGIVSGGKLNLRRRFPLPWLFFCCEGV